MDVASTALVRDIASAKTALLGVAAEDPERFWPAHKLKDRARTRDLSAGAVNMAFRLLLEDETFELVSGDLVRLKA